MSVTVAKFLDVADGLQANQFSIGGRYTINSISDLDATYKQLMDRPIPVIMAVIGGDGRPNLTPMWFDYEATRCWSTSPSIARRRAGSARRRK
jgi:hypothetical protein